MCSLVNPQNKLHEIMCSLVNHQCEVNEIMCSLVNPRSNAHLNVVSLSAHACNRYVYNKTLVILRNFRYLRKTFNVFQ
jgi:hypothetical protein